MNRNWRDQAANHQVCILVYFLAQLKCIYEQNLFLCSVTVFLYSSLILDLWLTILTQLTELRARKGCFHRDVIRELYVVPMFLGHPGFQEAVPLLITRGSQLPSTGTTPRRLTNTRALSYHRETSKLKESVY